MTANQAATSATQVRERGNALYKKGALGQAITAYKEAAALDPSDPYPLSNLSAAYFEAGYYADSVDAARKALEKPEFAADAKSAIAQKLLVRAAKSQLHLSHIDEAKTLLDQILPGKELDGLLCAVEDAAASQSAPGSIVREKLLQLPRVRPSIQDEPDYFGPGHDEVESLFTRELDRSCHNDPVMSFMLCGVGDARHLFKTLAFYFQSRSNKSQKVHFTLLDHKPTVIARILIFLGLMEEAGDTRQDNYDTVCSLLAVSYIFCAHLIPKYAAAKFHSVAVKIEAKLLRGESPFKCVHIQKSQMKGLATIIRRWHDETTEKYPTPQIRRRIPLDIMKGGGGGGSDFMQKCVREHRFFDAFSAMPPPARSIDELEPELAYLIKQWEAGGGVEVRRQIGQHIDTYWSFNPTLIDFDWEAKKQDQGPPDLGFDPFHIIVALTKGLKNPERITEAMSVVTSFFQTAIRAFHEWQDDITIEVVVGDMVNVLDRIRYDSFERPSPTSPKEYHVIHLSNIPDYVGGALTSFLYGGPLLKQGKGTGVTANVLRNPPRWKDLDNLNAEYLLMHDRKLIQKHFSVKLSPLTPELPPDSYDLMAPYNMSISDYRMWESVGRSRLALADRAPRAVLLKWLYAHLLKLCLPFPRPSSDFTLVYTPLNMTAFLRLLDLIIELGYPAHWISSVVSAVASGEITTTARAPRKYVMTPGAVDRVNDSRVICVRPWADEFATLAAMWRNTWPAGTLVLERELLPLASGISQYSIVFPDFDGPDLIPPHFMLVFWNQGKYDRPPRNLRPILLDDEKGDATSSARSMRADGVKVVSTFSWVRETNTAEFWLRGDVVDKMSADGWLVYIWRADVWGKLTGGVPLRDVIAKKDQWLGVDLPLR